MIKNFTIILSVVIISCGSENSATSPSLVYHPLDQKFIDDLLSVNDIKDIETISDRITTVRIVDTVGTSYYRIQSLHLADMKLDSLPVSIINLAELDTLILIDNNIEYLSESLCLIHNSIDSISYYNNNICTPTLPSCIDNNTTESLAALITDSKCEASKGCT